MIKKRTYTIDKNLEGKRLDNVLKVLLFDVPYGAIAKMARRGDVRCNTKKAKLSDRVALGDEIIIRGLASEGATLEAEAPKTLREQDFKKFQSWILHEDDTLLVLNKPAGLAVQGGSKLYRHLDDLALRYGGEAFTPRIVHRLDKDTSGVIVLAKTLEMARYLTALFKERTVTKTYMAITSPAPQEAAGVIDAPIFKRMSEQGDNMVVDPVNGASAQSTYKTISKDEAAALVELSPHTGRTHQLRVHMAHINAPILGDKKYGPKDKLPKDIPNQLYLHAAALEFKDPSGVAHAYTATLPAYFKTAMQLLYLNS